MEDQSTMRPKAHRWVIILAAGHGSRLRSFNRRTVEPQRLYFFRYSSNARS